MASLWKCACMWVVMASLALSVSARCACSDVRPRVTHDGPPLPFGCSDQRRFGKCDEPFMFDTIEELPEGYCQISCGRCDCCSTFMDFARDLGFNDFITLMEIAGMEEQANPAWMASVLLPPKGRFWDWLYEQGWTVESLRLNATRNWVLKETLKLHILPPVQPIDAVWTTPFFYPGNLVPTSTSYVLPLFSNLGHVWFSGPYNFVKLLRGDKEFCKGFLHEVDDIILAAPLEFFNHTLNATAEAEAEAEDADADTTETTRIAVDTPVTVIADSSDLTTTSVVTETTSTINDTDITTFTVVTDGNIGAVDLTDVSPKTVETNTEGSTDSMNGGGTTVELDTTVETDGTDATRN